MKNKNKNKSIEHVDYELKACMIFHPDDIYPMVNKQNKKLNKSKGAVMKALDEKPQNKKERKKKISS